MEEKSFRFEQEIDSLESIPESVRGIYQQDEASGKYKACDEITGVFAGMKSTIDKLRAERDELGRKSAELSGKLNEISTKSEVVEEPVIKEKVKKETKVTEQTDQVKVLQERLDSLTAMLKEKEEYSSRAALESTVSKALNKNNATELLTPHIKQNLKVKYENGNYEVNVIGANGEIRFSNDGTKPMTVDEYVAEMKNNPMYQPAFKSSGVTGAATKIKSSQAPAQMKSDRKMTIKERSDAILARAGF